MNYLPNKDPLRERGQSEEQLEEFRFLFEGLEHATDVHPPRWVLEEYLHHLRPHGIDLEGWQTHAISAHLGLCPSCRLQMQRLRRAQRLGQLRQAWRSATRWRRAYQYLTALMLIVGLLLTYIILRNPASTPKIGNPTPPPLEKELQSPGTGMGRRRPRVL